MGAKDPDACLQPELAIAGVLDGCAAHSLVRQAIMTELADIDTLTVGRRQVVGHLAAGRANIADADTPSERSAQESDVDAAEGLDETESCPLPIGEESGDDGDDGEQAELELL